MKWFNHARSLFLATLIFSVDLYFPLGYAGGVPYVFVLLSTSSLGKNSITFWAIVCSLLTIIGYWASPIVEVTPYYIILSNRVIALLLFWLLSFFLVQRINCMKRIEDLVEELIETGRNERITSSKSSLNEAQQRLCEISENLGCLVKGAKYD